jgi:hypothetical protein
MPVSLDTVGQRLIRSFTSKNRELATSAAPDKLLPTDSGIIEKRSHLDIVCSALSSLVVGRESPAVSLTSLGDDKAVVRGSRDKFALNVWKNRWPHEETGLLILIEKQVIPVEFGYFHATLGVVNATPNKDLAGLRDRESMMAATNDLFDVEIPKAFDNGGGLNRIVLVIRVLGNTSLTESVKSPGIDLPNIIDSKAVVVAATDLGDELALESKLTGNKSSNGGSRDDTASKLVLLPSSPGEDFALVVQCQDVIGSSSKSGDVLQLRDKSRGALSSDALPEAQNAIVALLVLETFRCRRKQKLTLNVPQP